MALSVEVLIPDNLSRTGLAMMEAMARTLRADPKVKCRVTKIYEGISDILMLYGVGAPAMAHAHVEHRRAKKHVIMWDQGYFGRKKLIGYLRASIDHWHPQALLSISPYRTDRWDAHGIYLREFYRQGGPIILIGIPPKSHVYLGEISEGWELRKYQEIQQRFPGRKVIYRPKPRRAHPHLPCQTDSTSPIEELLHGASLVITRHSNVAVDAIIAGVPVECEDGASMWLRGKLFDPFNRLDFLQRLAYWQWHPGESYEAWQFLTAVMEKM